MSSAPQLTDEAGLQALIEASQGAPVLIFKHSTRCSISSMALKRMATANPALSYHIIDVIANRPVSNKVAEVFSVHHESPQLLVIHKGECVYEVSHLEIQPKAVWQELQAINS